MVLDQFVAIWWPIYKSMRADGIRPADMRKEWRKLGNDMDSIVASMTSSVIGVVVSAIVGTVVDSLFGHDFIPSDEMVVVSPNTGREVTLPVREAISLIHRRGWLTKDIDTVFSMGYQFARLQALTEKAEETEKW